VPQRAGLARVEKGTDFVFLVAWKSVEEREAFRNGPTFSDYRATISEFLDGPPAFSHFEVRVTSPA
jgi:quinol monooxygenase YgiN